MTSAQTTCECVEGDVEDRESGAKDHGEVEKNLAVDGDDVGRVLVEETVGSITEFDKLMQCRHVMIFHGDLDHLFRV